MASGTAARAPLVLLVLSVAAMAVASPPPQAQPLTKQQPDQVDHVFFDRCSPGWIKYGDSCYRYFENRQHWLPAEEECIKHGGHLVSVASRAENGFLAKLTYCHEVWIGRYAIDADRTTQWDNYRWTDGTRNNGYHAHNFVNAKLHYPLISSVNLEWKNNVYHGDNNYVCKVKTANRNDTCNCPNGWKELNGNCYFMPPFEATYIEGDFYCRGRNAYMTSVHSDSELRALSLLDVDTYGCVPEIYIGLLKLNPCRKDFSTGNDICYRWSDRTDDTSVPKLKWMPGHPIGDRETNCVVLKDREIKTVPCHTRARFVCKKRVEKATN